MSVFQIRLVSWLETLTSVACEPIALISTGHSAFQYHSLKMTPPHPVYHLRHQQPHLELLLLPLMDLVRALQELSRALE
jgi:hypothetical protein